MESCLKFNKRGHGYVCENKLEQSKTNSIDIGKDSRNDDIAILGIHRLFACRG